VGQLLERLLIQPFLGYFLRDQTQCKRHSVKDGFGSWRATRDVKIHRNYLICTSQHVVAVEPATSSRRTGTDRECELRIWNSFR